MASASPTILQAEASIASILNAFINNPAWPVIWANQNAARPATNYLLLNRLNFNRLGRDIVGPVDSGTLNAPTCGTREFTVSVNAFGPGGEQILEDIRVFLDTNAASEALHSASLAVVDSGEIQDIPKLYGQQFKPRSMMDIFFRAHAYSADAEKNLGYIGRVDLQVNTIDPAGQVSSKNLIIETE